MASVMPNDFGADQGTEVSNREAVLQLVDEAIGTNKPPSVEYILVLPHSIIRLPFGLGFSWNSYGHAAVRYTLPDGTQMLMNIVGKKEGQTMVQLISPEDYLFSTSFLEKLTEQRGLYNREMIGIRIEDVPDEKILEMHKFFVLLRDDYNEHKVKFHILSDPIINFLRRITPFMHISERGNCAWWTSTGLLKAGVVTKRSMWPKSIFIDILENSHRTEAKDKANVHVVSYHRIRHAKLSYGVDAKSVDAVAPLQSLRSLFYWNLEKFASVIVDVPRNSTVAQVIKKDPEAEPSILRNLVNKPWITAGFVIFTGMFIFRRNVELQARMWNHWKSQWNTKQRKS